MKITFSFKQEDFYPGDSVRLSFSLHNPYEYDIDFDHRQFPVELCLIFLKGRELIVQQVFSEKPVHIVSAGETVDRTISSVIPDLQAGKYNLGISLNTIFGPSMNSRFKEIKIGSND
jgi:hypothetical protein